MDETEPTFDHTPPTAGEWRAAGIEEVAATAVAPTFYDQHDVLREAARAAREGGEIGRARALGLAADVMSMMLKTDDGQTVLFPIFIGGGRSSARVDAFTEEQIGFLRQVADEVRDPEMRARFADLLWSRRPEERWAQIAASAYLDSLRRLEAPLSMAFVDRLNRALAIARKIKRDPAPLRALSEYASALIERPPSGGNRWIQSQVAAVALRHKVGDRGRIYDLLIAEAERLRDAGDLMGPAGYYKVASDYAKALEDTDREERAIRGQAESVLREAAPFENGDPIGALTAASRYEEAIGIYRRRGRAFSPEIERLKTGLLALQELGQDAMAKIEVETPVPPEIGEFVEGVRGMPIAEALHRIALQAAPGDLAQMRQSVIDHIQEHPLLSLLGARFMKEGGKTDAKMTPLPLGQGGPDADAAYEERLRQEMLRGRVMSRDIAASLFIEPMRKIIAEENDPRRIDFSSLFEGHPFVPEDRKETFTKGFVYGLMGDYLVAAALLLPQIENSIRQLMRAAGLATSKFNKEGIQDEANLVQLLTGDEYRPDVDKLLGEGLAFELEGLLISRYGSNLRNNHAHGLVGDTAMKGPQACYFWALVFLILSMELPPTRQVDDPPSQEPASTSQ